MINYIVTRSGITAIINGREHTITQDNASYQQVMEAIVSKESEDTIEELFRTAVAIKRYSRGLIQVASDGGALFYKGEEVHNYVVDRILEFMQARMPVDPLLAFLERLMANPSKHSVDALYLFLENGKMPITEDGHFLGYKGITSDYKDRYSRKLAYPIGSTHRIPRRNVDDDFRSDCSYGFHIGTLAYAVGYGERTVIVKVDPADVVSVPDSNLSWKLRACAFSILTECQGALPGPCVNSASPYSG